MLHRFARLLLTRTAIAPILRTQARAACRSGEHRQAIVLSGVCALLVLTCTGRPIHMAAQVLGMLREPPSVLRVQTLASVPQTPGGCPRDASMTMSVRTPMNHRKPLQDRTRLPSGREPAAGGLAAGAGPARTTGPGGRKTPCADGRAGRRWGLRHLSEPGSGQALASLAIWPRACARDRRASWWDEWVLRRWPTEEPGG